MTAVQATRSTLYLSISLLIILLGFAIRLHNLSGDSLWIDELLTLNASENGLEVMTSQKDHPPLFYALTLLFIKPFGVNEFGARLPSLFAGTMAPALLILLGKLLNRRQASYWAALLLILSPFHLRYSQEARHYAVLMDLALVTTILLYLAMKRPSWLRWSLFSLATLATIYLHYGGLLILASQSVWIVVWLLQKWRSGQWPVVRYPLTAALAVIIFYLPWLSRLQFALERNVGADVVATNRGYSSTLTWIQSSLYEFGASTPILPYILLALFVAGLLWLLWQKDSLSLIVIITGLLPFLLIAVFQIARRPLPRYIIYIYPFYLLAIGMAIAALFWHMRRSYQWLPWVCALALGVLFIPLLQDEYRFVEHDWHGIFAQLAQRAGPDDVLIGYTMNYPGDLNIVVHSSPYQLQQAARNYTFLPGNNLTLASVAPLLNMNTAVWGILLNWKKPMPTDDPTLDIEPFMHDLYLVRQTNPTGVNALENSIALYEQLLFLADEPSPACELHRDLANLYAAKQDYPNANKALQTAVRQCSYLLQNETTNTLQTTIAYGSLDQALMSGEASLSHQWAAYILQHLNPTYEVALEILTVNNLLTQFEEGQVTLNDNNSPESPRLERFIMPQNGDVGQVIFDHPPAAISFPLHLPDEPVSLYFRMALAPRSWLWGGDGATFIVTAQAGDQPPLEIFRQHIGNALADRQWHVGMASLADYVGQPITLTLTTDAGPAGDGTGDWAGWDTPRLLWQVAPP